MSDTDRKPWHRVLPVLLFAAVAVALLLYAGVPAQIRQLPAGEGDGFVVPEHHIPPEYFKDAKPANPLPEPEMVIIIISQQTYERFSPADKPGILSVPIAYLDFTGNFTNSTSLPSWHYEKSFRPGDGVAMVRMPATMYDRFLKSATGPTLDLPASSFVRQYDNLSALHAQVRPEGTAGNVTDTGDDSESRFSPEVPAVIMTTLPTPPTVIMTTPRIY
jgi:hypothetical protein